MIKLAPLIIKKSFTLQEFFETKSFERIRSNTRWEKKLVIVRYYGFVAIVNKSRIKIIVKEVDGGVRFFWSIIPFWKMSRSKQESNKKIFHEGDLETQ